MDHSDTRTQTNGISPLTSIVLRLVRGPATLIALAGLSLIAGCGSPMAPDARRGYVALRMTCDSSGARPLRCYATTYCTGLYSCPDPAAEGRDVTATTEWSVDDPSVGRVAAAGVFEAVGTGSTVIRAHFAGIQAGDTYQPAAVIDGAALQPTWELYGAVYEAGKTVASGPIDGAHVEIVDGPFAGRSATTGVAPALPPGYLGPFGGPGGYRILGLPAGTYTLAVSAAGYAEQRRVVRILGGGSPFDTIGLTRMLQ